MYKISKYFIFLIILIICSSSYVYTANVDVPLLFTLFSMDSNFNISPLVYMQLTISGGAKYSTQITFNYYFTDNSVFNIKDIDLQQHTIYPSIYVDSLYATINNILNLLNFSIFYGKYLDICEGGKFNNLNYTYSTSNNFESVYQVAGYGINLNFKLLNNTMSFDIAGYQKINSLYKYSLDIYFRIYNLSNFQIFIGGGTDDFTIYRAAAKLVFSQENFNIKLVGGSQNLLTVSSITDLYLVFEQSIFLPQFKETFSIFSKPGYYGEESLSDSEKNSFIIYMDIAYNDKYETFFAGFLSNINLVNYSFSSIIISPYINFYYSGILWKFRINFNVTNLTNFFQSASISFETEF